MTRDQALKKIKKCLALAASANSHEAAAAMRQAQKLMAEHMVDAGDIALTQVETVTCSARTNSQPRWEAALANAVADAFGCAMIWSRSASLLAESMRTCYRSEVIFIGVGSAAQVAGYAWNVLSRQCAKGRLAHIRKQSPRCKPMTLTARGDEFAMGWVYGVAEKLEAFAQTDRQIELIERYKSETWPDATSFEPKNRAAGRNVTLNDLREGFVEGRRAQLDRGVGNSPLAGLIA